MIADNTLENKFGKKLVSDAKWELEDNLVSILDNKTKDNGALSYTIKVNNKKEKFDVALVIGANFDSIIGFCSCSDSHNDGICKHMVMGCIEINNHIEKSKLSNQKKATDTYKLDLLKNIYLPQNKIDILNVYLYIKELNNTDVLLGLKVSIMGNKPYVVKNTEQFLDDVKYNRHINLGKGFDTHNYEIDKQSYALVRELTLLKQELIKRGDKLNTSYISFSELSSLIATQINHEIFYMDEEFVIKDRLDDIVLHVDYISEDEFVVKLKKSSFFEKLDSNLIINKANKLFYYLEDDQMQKIKLLESFDETDREFVVSEEYAREFIQDVIPNIYSDFEMKFDNRFEFEIIDDKFSSSLFCYLENKVIKIKVDFKYGNYSVYEKQNNILIKRNYNKENLVIQGLINQGYAYNPDEKVFYIEASKMQYYFLTKSIFAMKQDYEVYLDDKLQNAILNFDSSSISIDINGEHDSDYFEINFDIPDIDPSEIDDIIKSINDKKEYHRLNNDTFLRLNDSRILLQLMFLKEVIADNSHTLNTYRIPVYKSFLVKEKASKLFENVTVNKEFNDYVDKITLIKPLEDSAFSDVDYKLRDYQKVGVDWLTGLYKSKLGALLADEMGLGKTLQVISFFDINKIDNALIIVPKALLYNWKNEFKKFAPHQEVVILDGHKLERENLVKNLCKSQIVLVSYNTLINDHELLKDYEFDTVVIDEAQYIKNPTTKTSRTAKMVNANFFIALTGTPIENNLLEFWSIFDFIIPGYLDDMKSFKANYVSKTSDKNKMMQTLKDVTKPFVLRRSKKNVLTEIPDKIVTDIYCQMEDVQKSLYANYLKEVKQKDITDLNAIEVLATITRLRQLSIDPKLFMSAYQNTPGKLSVFEEIIDEIVASEQKVVVFSQYTTVLKSLSLLLNEKGIKFNYLDGDTKPKQRLMDVERFNKSKTPVYLISLKAGGVGLNLTSASNVIIYDPWWNPATEAQAIDRTHRLGQKNAVQVFRFLSADSIEEKIYELNKTKTKLAYEVLDDDVNYLNQLSSDEIKDLLIN